ncbi:cysteine-rich and transmembrane domain-containing protein 1-like [Sphaeramia orbicularis]|uniref:cysteine-rich and transmembrane domain-containing protein 1-like n=1 Tax=Sphaeramia orbicularis TaxID=375764 RepID=UPI00117ECD79|nr:cysteine-rich and transmembrane domain-containing protein 1-like [Sphaeramia orbicularis]
MDPSKSPSAPPPDWSGGKANVGPAPPPPYEDVPQMGYGQPGAGYPVQGHGAAPQYSGYGQPYPGQPYPSQLYPGQSELGQPYPGQPYPGQPYPGQLYAGQPVAVSVQPTVYVPQGPLENPVNDYLCYSIFTMVCCSCCLPLGIAALIYSITAREANHVGDRMAAERSSRTARTLNHVALGIGIGVMVLSIVYILVLVLVN